MICQSLWGSISKKSVKFHYHAMQYATYIRTQRVNIFTIAHKIKIFMIVMVSYLWMVVSSQEDWGLACWSEWVPALLGAHWNHQLPGIKVDWTWLLPTWGIQKLHSVQMVAENIKYIGSNSHFCKFSKSLTVVNNCVKTYAW